MTRKNYKYKITKCNFVFKLRNGELMQINKCSIYLRNASIGPSCHYRINQYMIDLNLKCFTNNLMSKWMFRLNTNHKDKKIYLFLRPVLYSLMLIRFIFFISRDFCIRPNIVVIQRTTLPRFIPKVLSKIFEKNLKRSTVYWDFDDNIFDSAEISSSEIKLLEKYSDRIIVTNNFLKNKISKEFQYKVSLLPTTDGYFRNYNLKMMNDIRKKNYQDEVRLVWVGTSGNLKYLDSIKKSLDIAASKLKFLYKKSLKLIIVSNIPYLSDFEFLIVENRKWSREITGISIISAHIGIMPLALSEFALGKGGFKIVQYLSAGVPVIASKIGFNSEIVDIDSGKLIDDIHSQEGWINSIIDMSISYEKWENFSRGAHKRWNEKFQYEKNLTFWKELLSAKNYGFERKVDFHDYQKL